MSTEERELEKQIKEKKNELAALQKKNEEKKLLEVIKSLSEYTVEEKIKIFDAMYNDALNTLEKKKNGQYFDDNDDAHYDWEEKMSLLAKDKNKFWEYWRSLK